MWPVTQCVRCQKISHDYWVRPTFWCLWTLNEIRACMSNYTQCFVWHMITHPCPTFERSMINAPSLYWSQYWHVITEAQWHLAEGNFTEIILIYHLLQSDWRLHIWKYCYIPMANQSKVWVIKSHYIILIPKFCRQALGSHCQFR